MNKNKIKKTILLLENQLSNEQSEEDVYRFEKFIESKIEDIDYEVRELYEQAKAMMTLKKLLENSLQKSEEGDPFEAVILIKSQNPNFIASEMMKNKEIERIIKSIYTNFG